jgi:hypothetical protein
MVDGGTRSQIWGPSSVSIHSSKPLLLYAHEPTDDALRQLRSELPTNRWQSRCYAAGYGPDAHLNRMSTGSVRNGIGIAQSPSRWNRPISV